MKINLLAYPVDVNSMLANVGVWREMREFEGQILSFCA